MSRQPEHRNRIRLNTQIAGLNRVAVLARIKARLRRNPCGFKALTPAACGDEGSADDAIGLQARKMFMRPR
jgi:hypothetical protein